MPAQNALRVAPEMLFDQERLGEADMLAVRSDRRQRQVDALRSHVVAQGDDEGLRPVELDGAGRDSRQRRLGERLLAVIDRSALDRLIDDVARRPPRFMPENSSSLPPVDLACVGIDQATRLRSLRAIRMKRWRVVASP
jgi:hypothetical protein